jgi:hypothetical protein
VAFTTVTLTRDYALAAAYPSVLTVLSGYGGGGYGTTGYGD